MRAARTPPEPPPITNRSTSCEAIAAFRCPSNERAAVCQHPGVVPQELEVMTSLLHFRAKPAQNLVGRPGRPHLRETNSLLEHLRFLRDQFLAKWRLVEREKLFELRFGKAPRIEGRHLVHQ